MTLSTKKIDEELLRIATEPDLELRVARLRELANLFPGSAPVWLRLSQAALDAHQAEVGLRAFDHALALDHTCIAPSAIPDHLATPIEAFRNIVRLAKSPRDEIEALRRLVHRFPAFAPALFNLAILYARQGNACEARIWAERAIRWSPTLRQLLHSLLQPLLEPSANGAAEAAMDSLVGTTVQGVRILARRTAAPGLVVYDALDAADAPVTVLRPTAPTADTTQIFQRQVAAAPVLHVVRALAVVHTYQGLPLLVLERVHGVLAWERFRSASDLDIGLSVVWLAARALPDTERARYVHGQIGPCSVVINDANLDRPVLFLPGIDGCQLQDGTLPLDVDPTAQRTGVAADVYGLGLLLHYAVTGALPKYGRVSLQLLPASPVGKQVTEIIKRCLAPEPHDRFRTARELASRLDRLFGQPPLEVAVGVILDDRWRVEALMSDEGAYASVYRATDLHHGRTVALKVLRPEHRRREMVFRLHLEAMATPRHPGVVEVLGSSSFLSGPRTPYIAMELVDGITLREQLERRGRLLPGHVVMLGIELAEALAFSHRHSPQVIHRDVNPNNIMVMAPGKARRVKLIDFGVAKVDAAAIRTRWGTAVGTPPYMALEQFQHPEHIDTAVDVYALGIVLAECITGIHPLAGRAATTDWCALHQHHEVVAEGALAWLQPAYGAVVADLERLLRRMTDRTPARRPTAREVYVELQELSRGLRGTPYGPTLVPASLPTLVPTEDVAASRDAIVEIPPPAMPPLPTMPLRLAPSSRYYRLLIPVGVVSLAVITGALARLSGSPESLAMAASAADATVSRPANADVALPARTPERWSVAFEGAAVSVELDLASTAEAVIGTLRSEKPLDEGGRRVCHFWLSGRPHRGPEELDVVRQDGECERLDRVVLGDGSAARTWIALDFADRSITGIAERLSGS